MEGYEDTLTSTLFERLLYLPDEVVHAVLFAPTFWPADEIPSAAPIAEVAFWPNWPAPVGSPDRQRVEPDVVIDFPSHRLVVEAKRSDLADQQGAGQLALEWRAAQDGRPVWLLTVGGLVDTRRSTFEGKRAQVLAHLNLAQEQARDFHFGHASWTGLFQAIDAQAGDRPQARRLIADLEAGLALHRVRTRDAGWLVDLVNNPARGIATSPHAFAPAPFERRVGPMGRIATPPSAFRPGK